MFKTTQFNEEDILNWCQEVETIYIADPDSMILYKTIPLPLSNGFVTLPPNLYKILDVYDNPKKNNRLSYNKLPKKLYIPNVKEETIYLNYVGTPINEDCIPLIHADHQPACETFCLINHFMEDALNNKINQNMYFDWKQRFDGMIQAAKAYGRDWDAQRLQRMDIILGSQIPKIGFMPLVHNDTEYLNINDNGAD